MRWIVILLLLVNTAAADVGGSFTTWFRPSDTASGVSVTGRLDSLELSVGGTADTLFKSSDDDMEAWASVEGMADNFTFSAHVETTWAGALHVGWKYRFFHGWVGVSWNGRVEPAVGFSVAGMDDIFPYASITLSHGWSIDAGVGFRLGDVVLRASAIAFGDHQPLWMNRGRTRSSGTAEALIALEWVW